MTSLTRLESFEYSFAKSHCCKAEKNCRYNRKNVVGIYQCRCNRMHVVGITTRGIDIHAGHIVTQHMKSLTADTLQCCRYGFPTELAYLAYVLEVFLINRRDV